MSTVSSRQVPYRVNTTKTMNSYDQIVCLWEPQEMVSVVERTKLTWILINCFCSRHVSQNLPFHCWPFQIYLSCLPMRKAFHSFKLNNKYLKQLSLSVYLKSCRVVEKSGSWRLCLCFFLVEGRRDDVQLKGVNDVTNESLYWSLSFRRNQTSFCIIFP